MTTPEAAPGRDAGGGSGGAPAAPGADAGATRIAALGMLVVAALGLWQASTLERWSFDGPGPGLFPLGVAVVCVALSIVVLVFPGRASRTEEGDTEPLDEPTRRKTRATFVTYWVALGVMAAGAAWLGFALTAIATSVLIVRFAEHRSWTAALVYGVACALVGLVAFGWLLRVDLPAGFVERAFFALVR